MREEAVLSTEGEPQVKFYLSTLMFSNEYLSIDSSLFMKAQYTNDLGNDFSLPNLIDMANFSIVYFNLAFVANRY